MASYRPAMADVEPDGQGSSRARLVMLHGFTQIGASWASTIEHLGSCAVSTPDLPGHGTASTVRADLWRSAEQLAVAHPGPACWVGYSLGGRTALHVALSHPDKVRSLVLISATAGLVAEEERRDRVASDEALAARIEAGGGEGLTAFVDEWLSLPLFATLPRDKAGVDERRSNTAQGLASSLRLCGLGRQQPLWPRLAELRDRRLPVLVITGSLDQRYCALGERMVQQIGPSARRFTVGAAGHACHLERPEVVGPAIAEWATTYGPN